MQTDLRDFLSRLAGVVFMTLMPLAFIAFVSIPLNLSRHPGDMTRHAAGQPPQHMT